MRKNDEKIRDILAIAPPPNSSGVTFFEEKTLQKLNGFELRHLEVLLEQYYVPRVKPTEEFRAGFSCPICSTSFHITATE